jgi:hypothetical protein
MSSHGAGELRQRHGAPTVTADQHTTRIADDTRVEEEYEEVEEDAADFAAKPRKTFGRTPDGTG